MVLVVSLCVLVTQEAQRYRVERNEGIGFKV